VTDTALIAESVNRFQDACLMRYARGEPRPGLNDLVTMPEIRGATMMQTQQAADYLWRQIEGGQMLQSVLEAEAKLFAGRIPAGDSYWRNAGSDER
jgi:hypothetical protein